VINWLGKIERLPDERMKVRKTRCTNLVESSWSPSYCATLLFFSLSLQKYAAQGLVVGSDRSNMIRNTKAFQPECLPGNRQSFAFKSLRWTLNPAQSTARVSCPSAFPVGKRIFELAAHEAAMHVRRSVSDYPMSFVITSLIANS
jgi:hypothetical protein